ncbi:helix-turn-helix transcriptional regulator [Infirmifilum lucidum]|uniref:Helix-turn-helix transcriptional regulator n=1 Tax=Infirmifilum lucidum TaxID=2776706 RepID=A0A7L9FIF9_9CREN|nr:metalloregulator ArsR/SmtB family transcription factor [Infirmifilum lucidum]QOJ78555.1 helix-turn-helix transcriptional regulator [Infirmifilum lucidum]
MSSVEEIPKEELYQLQARLCKFMSHPLRLRLLELLEKGERSVSELAELTGEPQPVVSRHLAYMQQLGIVSSERRGNRVYYKIRYPELREACRIIQGVLVKILREGRSLALVSE